VQTRSAIKKRQKGNQSGQSSQSGTSDGADNKATRNDIKGRLLKNVQSRLEQVRNLASPRKCIYYLFVCKEEGDSFVVVTVV